jgi:hypothetical protein
MQTIEEIFNKITCNGNREMTLERFKEAIVNLNDQSLKELAEEAEGLMTILLPPEDFGEDINCDRLYRVLEIIKNYYE